MHLHQPATYWIDNLKLKPHPEGGYYKEVYRASESIPHTALPPRFSGERSFATSIYYLLEQGDFSAFHRIQSDETWHFYAGGSLQIITLHNDQFAAVSLGGNISEGECLQVTIPAGVWFAATPNPATPYTLAGCSVSPGFDFADFEMAKRSELIKAYPSSEQIIRALTRT
jgi:predicted cupin superfamily sugar epimerase